MFRLAEIDWLRFGIETKSDGLPAHRLFRLFRHLGFYIKERCDEEDNRD